MRSSRKVLAFTLALFLLLGSLGAGAACAAEAGGAEAGDEPAYTLNEEVVIRGVVIGENETPLGAGPAERDCCVLHFVLMLCALGVTVYYTCDQKRHQKREFELRAELR